MAISGQTVGTKYLIVGLLMLVAITAIFMYSSAIRKTNLKSGNENTFNFQTSKVTAVIIGADQIDTEDFTKQLNTALGSRVDLKSSIVDLFGDNIEPWKFAKELKVDLILEVKKESDGRYGSLFIFADDDSQKALIYADVLDRVTKQVNTVTIFNNASSRLLSMLGYKETSTHQSPVPTIEAVQALHNGLVLFNKPKTTAFISLANSSIYSAIDLSPNYLHANIQLCKGLFTKRCHY